MKPWHQFHKIMKHEEKKWNHETSLTKARVGLFFFVYRKKWNPMKPNLQKLWNHEVKKWNHETNLDTRFIGLFYVTQWGFNRNLLYFFLFFRQLSRETGWNWLVLVSDFFGSKMKPADGFMILWGIKLWNRQVRSEKIMKLTARGFAACR